MGNVPKYEQMCVTFQGYLTRKETHPPRTLPSAYASSPRGVRGGWAFSDERGTPVQTQSRWTPLSRGPCWPHLVLACASLRSTPPWKVSPRGSVFITCEHFTVSVAVDAPVEGAVVEDHPSVGPYSKPMCYSKLRTRTVLGSYGRTEPRSIGQP